MFGRRRGNSNAFWALASAAGLWAWQNRDQIKGWVSQAQQQYGQRSMSGQYGGSSQSQTLPQYGSTAQNEPSQYSGPMTGETRRISPDEVDRIMPNDTRTPGENI